MYILHNMDWSMLLVTLPTQPSAVRLRIWRALKGLGCAALRDGAYLLPRAEAAALEEIAAEVLAHGGTASVIDLAPRAEGQQAEWIALFDRGAAYAEWQQGVQALRAELPQLGETEARRRLRGVAEGLSAVQRIDYFPGPGTQQAEADLAQLRRELDAQFSAGEPHAADGEIQRLDPARYVGRRWTTRARPWVDRLACAWFVRRFIDADARIEWFAEGRKPPRGALGFDYDGAAFSHIGSRVSFEVMAASFGREADPRLRRVAAAVHYLDVGGIPVPEAAGLETILAGLRDLHADDDALLAAACPVFDALYVAPATRT